MAKLLLSSFGGVPSVTHATIGEIRGRVYSPYCNEGACSQECSTGGVGTQVRGVSLEMFRCRSSARFLCKLHAPPVGVLAATSRNCQLFLIVASEFVKGNGFKAVAIVMAVQFRLRTGVV
eukprot:6355646-Amphidinium_carterae.1